MTKQLKSVFIIFFVAIAVGVFFWVAKNFGGGEGVESEKPAVICKPQNALPENQQCFWTAHIHAEVKVFKNSEVVAIRFEQGELEKEHTHSELNKLHWHGLVAVDPRTREVKDWSSLRVDAIPKDLKLQIEGQPKFIVNSKEVDPSYIWQDGDMIEIRYE